MAKKKSTKRKKPAATEQLSDAMRVTRGIAWGVLVAAWLLVVVSLASHHPGDRPNPAVGVPTGSAVIDGQWLAAEGPRYRNWVGRVGASIAHNAYAVIGPGVWVALLGIAAYLVMASARRPVNQPVLRTFGLVVVALSVSCAAVAVPAAWAVATGHPPYAYGPQHSGGLFAVWAQDQLAMRFGPVGTLLIVFTTFWVGAILAADRLVLAVPKLLIEAIARLANLPRPDFSRIPIPTIRLPRPRFPVLHPALADASAEPRSGGSAGVGSRRKKRRPDPSAPIDEDAGGFAGTEPFDPDDEVQAIEDEAIEDEAVEDEYEDDEAYEDEEAEAEAPEAYAEGKKKFDPAELRKKMAQLPINFAPPTRKHTEPPREPDLSGYQFPGLDLLEEPETGFTEEIEAIVRDQAVQLESALQQYKIEGEVVGIDSGPVITLFEVRLSPGTKVSSLNTISSDLARALKAQNIRIVANQAGKDTVGIEVPNLKKEKVRLKELMSASGDSVAKMKLPMFLGKDASGTPLVQDLNAMPHMLIAGTTGSGKSVCMNSIIMSFLYTKRPDELKLVLVDPKMVEMSMFKNIPHLMCPVVTEMAKAAAILEWAVTKMDERYELLAEAGVRDIASYNELDPEELKERFEPATEEEWARLPKKLPYMVFVIDELADLMMTNKEVEASIVRIAQKARAVGIHLILATQRPQANVVTGLIKSNMPSRVAFKVASGMDSRIVLDQKGGELLLGHGDMLFLSPRSSKLTRAQGTLVDDSEVRKVAKFLKNEASQHFEPQLVQIKSGGGGGEGELDSERDELFDEAVDVVIETQRGSVSLLQRRLQIGYSRSSRIIEQIAEAGMLGPYKGSQAREVVITKEEWEAMKAQAAADAEAGVGGEADGEAWDDDEDGGAPAVYASSSGGSDDDGGVPAELDGEYRQ